MNMEYILKVLELLKKDDFFSGDVADFGGLICMMLEEYCRRNDMDVVDFADEIAENVRETNNELGKYEI